MESLSFALEGQELLAGDAEYMRSRNLLKGWNAEGFPAPVTVSDVFQSMESIESGLLDMPRKSVISTQCLEHLVDNAIGVGTRLSNLAVEIGSEKLVPSSLEIMKPVSSRQRKCDKFTVDNSLLSSQEPALSAKRARVENSSSHVPVCLVHGCNKDLSLLKEYHRKHKVCDVHSKTSVVIVNGVGQRFCQQCSRFQKLAEFDEGKRSCQKRLAEHNERRRKPQLGSMLFKKDFLSWQCTEPSSVKTNQIPHSGFPLKFDSSVSHSFLCLPESGKRYHPSKACLNSMQTAVELSCSSSGCAPSLLSSKSQSPLNHSEMDNSVVSEGCCPSNLALNENSTEPDDAGVCLSFETPQELLEESSSLNMKSHANTVDLLQLSLHLQRVLQQQKCSAENEVS